MLDKIVLNAHLSNSLKKSGFFSRIMDPSGENETSSFAQNQEIALQINRNKQYYNHLSPNRNFRLYQEGCLGSQSERVKYKSQEYAITVKNEAVKRVNVLADEFSKVVEKAEGHLKCLENFTMMNKHRIEEEIERRRQLLKARRLEASSKPGVTATSLPFPL